MTIHFSGLNLVKKATENFSLSDRIDLSKLHLTFESIYFVDFPSQILLFDFKLHKFIELKFAQIKRLITVCSNTNYLYCLNSNENGLSLVQISSSKIVKEVSLSDLESISQPLLLSTDINLYLFESLNGLKLKWSNDREKRNSKLAEQEKQLNESSVSVLPLNEVLIDENVKEVSTGKEHCLILTDKGKIYSFGLGTKGQLGHGKIENIYRPKLINSFKDVIIKIACGGWHSAALDFMHNAYFWGWNSSNQLGVEDLDDAFLTLPTKIIINDFISNDLVRFKQLSLGARHSALIDTNNNIYTFGWNKYNQLFHKVDEDEEPTKILQFEKCVKNVKCGSWCSLVETFE